MGSHSQTRDVFAEAKARYTIMDGWRMLGVPGDPKIGNNFSPFRDEKDASCSIYEDGRKFKDQGDGGEQGDIIAFIHAVTDWTHAEIREWLMERLGIDHHEGNARVPLKVFTPAPEPATSPKVIQWPWELLTGTEETWARFAKLRGLSCTGVWTMVHVGILRFCKAEGHKCFVVTDDERRAGEIRRIDGGTFASGGKVYPLPGVDKSWLPGADLIAGNADILVTEGATDLLTGFDKYVAYRKAGGPRRWCPMALLGSKCKTIDCGLLAQIKGRHVRLVPDPDDDGDIMLENMQKLLTEAGCIVDVVKLPRGRDLTDVKDEIEPRDLYS